jgi:predicted O-methyltransferase YrrM
MRRVSRERAAAVAVGLIYLAVFYGAWSFFGQPAILVAMATLLTLLLLFGLHTIRRIRRDIQESSRELQSVLDIRSAIGGEISLPPFGSPAVEADCASVIVRHILRQRPQLIVEAGSGSSTVLAAACLKRIGSGRVVALEHLEQFAEVGRTRLRDQGLSDWGDVRYAPLEPQECNGRSVDWFATSAQQFDRPIDLLFVDGPPSGGTVAPQGRYPALPILADRLADEAWVILDDANRGDTKKMLARWREQFADWGYDEATIPTKRGTGLIHLRRPR